MKRKTFSILFALVLVISMSLVAVPTNVGADPGTIITSVVRSGGATGGQPQIITGPSLGGLQENSRTYADRTYIWQNVPVELLGADYVKTYCDDKMASGVSYAVTLSQDATLYVLIDDRYIAGTGWRSFPYEPLIDPPFPWMLGSSAVFADTGLRLSHTGYTVSSNCPYNGEFWVYAADVSAGTYTLGKSRDYESYISSRTFYGIAAVAMIRLDIEKELLAGPEEIDIYLPEPTPYTFQITYSNPDPTTPVRIIDTVPAEFEILSVDSHGDGTAIFFDTSRGRGNSANRIEWDLPVGTQTATLTVEIQTVQSPGHKKGDPVFKPTSCGPLLLNDGATAFEVDPVTGEIVRVEEVDPDTGEVTLVPVVIVGPSDALVVEAVGEEDEDDD